MDGQTQRFGKPERPAQRRSAPTRRIVGRTLVSASFRIGVLAAAILLIAVMIWQGITTHGMPDPTQPNTSPTVAFMEIGVLVFREGLECVLVIAAITASMTGSNQVHRRPVAIGAGIAFLATLITWSIAARIVGHLTETVSALELQAATGLLAVIVLLVIMNWFFHKIYWGGWIRAHNRRKKALFANSNGPSSRQSLFWGLILLGFTSLYREGFEVVLFLQSYNLQLGAGVVLKGALLGLFLSGIVAALTFVLQKRLPYRKMLISTGILLGVVLLVMAGEEAQEMQLAHWISRTDIDWLTNVIPAWMGMWFAVFPTYETMAAQLVAAILVVGSYYGANRVLRTRLADGRTLANETEQTGALFPTRPIRTLKDCSFVSRSRQNAPSLQTVDYIEAGGDPRQPPRTRQSAPQPGGACPPVQNVIPGYSRNNLRAKHVGRAWYRPAIVDNCCSRRHTDSHR
jgi:high-affinity iron transporter